MIDLNFPEVIAMNVTKLLEKFANFVGYYYNKLLPAKSAFGSTSEHIELVAVMLGNCIDDDIVSPVPRQLLNQIKSKDYLSSVTSLYMCWATLAIIGANYENNGYELDPHWSEKLSSAHDHIFLHILNSMKTSDVTLVQQNLTKIYNLCFQSIEESNPDLIYSFKYVAKEELTDD